MLTPPQWGDPLSALWQDMLALSWGQAALCLLCRRLAGSDSDFPSDANQLPHPAPHWLVRKEQVPT